MGVATSTVEKVLKANDELSSAQTSSSEDLNASDQRFGGLLSDTEWKRIIDSLQKLRVNALKVFLQERQLGQTGNKTVLVEKIVNACE